MFIVSKRFFLVIFPTIRDYFKTSEEWGRYPKAAEDVRKQSKMSEGSRRCPNTAEDVQRLPKMSKDCRRCPKTAEDVLWDCQRCPLTYDRRYLKTTTDFSKHSAFYKWYFRIMYLLSFILIFTTMAYSKSTWNSRVFFVGVLPILRNAFFVTREAFVVLEFVFATSVCYVANFLHSPLDRNRTRANAHNW